MYLRKRWKIRDVSDPEYAKLGDTPDVRRVRADLIESEIANNWKWLFEKPKDVLMGTLGFLMIMGVLATVMYLSGGSSVESCSGSYTNGDIDLATLRKQCPNLSKESLLQSISDYRGSNKQELILDVESNFN